MMPKQIFSASLTGLTLPINNPVGNFGRYLWIDGRQSLGHRDE
jgi:hypothetical protein